MAKKEKTPGRRCLADQTSLSENRSPKAPTLKLEWVVFDPDGKEKIVPGFFILCRSFFALQQLFEK